MSTSNFQICWVVITIVFMRVTTEATPAPFTGDKLAIDVSHYQGEIDWSLIPDNVERAIAKSTEGAKYVDPTFARNWEGMTKRRLCRGAYHYFTFSDSPEAQAQNILSTLKSVNFSDGLSVISDIIAIDVEGTICPATPTALGESIEALIKILQSAYHTEVVVYTRASYWDLCVNSTWYWTWIWQPLWVSHYTTQPRPTLPKPWDTWSMWQFTDAGWLPGIKKNLKVDLSYIWNTGDFIDDRVHLKTGDQAATSETYVIPELVAEPLQKSLGEMNAKPEFQNSKPVEARDIANKIDVIPTKDENTMGMRRIPEWKKSDTESTQPGTKIPPIIQAVNVTDLTSANAEADTEIENKNRFEFQLWISVKLKDMVTIRDLLNKLYNFF